MEMIELDNNKEDIEMFDELGNQEINPDDIIEFDYDKTEHIYLDENNMIVEDEDKAVKRISKYYDKDGNLVQEVVAYRNEEEINEEFVTEFTDEQGNIVEEDVAYYAVYKRLVDGEVVNEEKVTIERDEEMSL